MWYGWKECTPEGKRDFARGRKSNDLKARVSNGPLLIPGVEKGRPTIIR